ncbi:hypothetical protein [Pseudooceanicola sp.]|jgi:hypothetical protein|uniref:hypothetical protein n=1 Tax=Pseudooceanicola sp. TaxID=1914328 RepID=UPI004058E85D
MKGSWNKNLGLTIFIGGALLVAALWIAIYLAPTATFSHLSSVESKAIAATLALALTSASGLLLFYIYHTPTARRLVLSAFRFISIMSISATGFSFFGWPRVLALTLNEDSGLNAQFSLSEIALETAPVLLYSTISVTIIASLYVFSVWLEPYLKEEN